MKKILFVALVAVLFVSCAKKESHFITNDVYREQVFADYDARKFSEERKAELNAIMADSSFLNAHKEALHFLYAYMPLCDVADYSAYYFKQQVEYAFFARETFSWGKTIPEDIFRHFVLVHRVNNENMDTARVVFFNELRDRVRDLSMYDAALEVNHWCHEKVTYRPADARTSSPLATMRTALGRCGEESTFAVTALRAVGIPARQCYTPRWAHTDDNHAWVEVWIDGKWYYMGACEPDARLNMGWFSIPATRTMMVHSNAYGKYHGDEEVNEVGKLFSRLNMLGNYTETRKVRIHVVDTNDVAVEGADVQFKLYNYAEYFSISSGVTDKEGNAYLTTGLGDLLIWASKEGRYAYAKLDVREAADLTLKLNRVGGEEYVEMLDIIPPVEGRVAFDLTDEEIAANRSRLHYEDSVRNAYVSTFPKRDFVKTIKNENLTEEQIWQFVQLSEGNYVEIAKFLNDSMVSARNGNLFLYDFLNSLAQKDLRDTEAETLLAMLVPYNETKYPVDVYKKGIMPARIANELLRPYHELLGDRLRDDEVVSVEDVRRWTIGNVAIDDEMNYVNCPISANGVYDLRMADAHSRNIFFVSACRSIGIPAYIDNATGEIFAYDGEWRRIVFEAVTATNAVGELVLTYETESVIMPEYWIHYTIARFVDGEFVTYDFEGDSRVSEFPVRLQLEPGYYMLSTGSRYSDGNTLSRLQFFNIVEGEETVLPLVLRELTTRDIEYGTITLADYAVAEGVAMADMAKEHDLVVAFIDPNREPTRHLFNDVKAYREPLEQWGGNMIFYVPSDFKTKDFNEQHILSYLPEKSQVVIDDNGAVMARLLKEADIYFRDNYPLVLIIDSEGRITFKTEGYRIGTGELIYKSLRK